MGVVLAWYFFSSRYYGYLHRDLHQNGGGLKPLHMQQAVVSIRIGMRGNLLYPITCQLQGGSSRPAGSKC